MKFLILGDVVGISGRKALKSKLPNLIIKNNIDFVIVNGENSADDGKGITQEIAEEFFKIGVDVITSGNHIWDKQETSEYINTENAFIAFVLIKLILFTVVNKSIITMPTPAFKNPPYIPIKKKPNSA